MFCCLLLLKFQTKYGLALKTKVVAENFPARGCSDRFKTYFQRFLTVLCWNRPSMSSFGFARSVVLKKKSHQENCNQLRYFLANVSLKLCSPFVMGLTEMWPLWRSIASSKPRFHPTFPWFSDLTSCWEALALASGSVEITSCSKSSWMRPFAQVPFDME